MNRNRQDNQDVKEMVMRVLQEKDQWAKHVAHSCQKCEKCTCGKHKCKLAPMKLGLKPTTSTYNESYQKRNITFTQKLQIPNMNYSSCQFVQKSQYRNEYVRKKNKLQKTKQIKGKGNIELGGPVFLNTTYDDTFTPKGNAKQTPIKNPNNINSLGMKMQTHSSYRDNFKQYRNVPVTKPIKRQNNLKTDYDTPHCLGKSNYTCSYQNNKIFKKNPQIDNFKPARNYTSTQGVRTKTSYQNDYSQKKGCICPASYL